MTEKKDITEKIVRGRKGRERGCHSGDGASGRVPFFNLCQCPFKTAKANLDVEFVSSTQNTMLTSCTLTTQREYYEMCM